LTLIFRLKIHCLFISLRSVHRLNYNYHYKALPWISGRIRYPVHPYSQYGSDVFISSDFLCRFNVIFLFERRAVSPPGLARDDWKIIRALSEVRRHFFLRFVFHFKHCILKSVRLKGPIKEGRKAQFLIQNCLTENINYNPGCVTAGQYGMKYAVRKIS
jgi:hypothetical protein